MARANTVGVTIEQLDDACDTDNPKAAVIVLLASSTATAHSVGVVAGRARRHVDEGATCKRHSGACL